MVDVENGRYLPSMDHAHIATIKSPPVVIMDLTLPPKTANEYQMRVWIRKVQRTRSPSMPQSQIDTAANKSHGTQGAFAYYTPDILRNVLGELDCGIIAQLGLFVFSILRGDDASGRMLFQT